MTDHRWQYDAHDQLWRCTPPPSLAGNWAGCRGCGAVATHREYSEKIDLGLGLYATLNQIAHEKEGDA